MAWLIPEATARARVRVVAGAGGRGPPRLRALDDPRLARVRKPAAGPGGGQRPERDRLRHLRLARPAHPRPLPGRGTGAPGRDAGRGDLAQPPERAAAARRAVLRGRADRPAVAGPRPGAPAGPPGCRADVRGDQPGLPGGHHLGDLPPRRRAGARAPGHRRAAGPGRAHRPGRRLPRLDAPRGLARGDAGRGRLPALLGRAAAHVRHGLTRHGGAVRGARPADGGGRAALRRARRPGHLQLPDLAVRIPGRPGPRAPERGTRGRPRPGGDVRGAHPGAGRRAWPLAGGRLGTGGTGGAAAACFTPLDLGAGPGDGPDPIGDVRVYTIACP